MFKIIKKTSAVWQHELNGQIIHLSSFGVVADISLQTFILRALNGSYFPNQSVGIANIIVIDETDASVEESFATINELLNRLIELNYTPYITENSLQLTLQQVTDNGATTTNQIATGNLTIDEVGGGDPCINTNQSLADGSIISAHIDTDSEFGISVRFPATITGNRNIDYPDANGTIATQQWVLDNLPAGGVESVNTQTGVVVLDADDISDSATTNKFVTSAEKSTWNGKQDALVSGTNIKTIEGQSLLGSGNIDLTKSDVGLGNADNTSDLNKPISTATQTALNSKQDSLVSGTNIKTIEGLNALGSGDLEYYNNLAFEQNFGYMIPNLGSTAYTSLRNTTSISQTGQTQDFNNPSRILYASSTTIGSFCIQRGTVGGNFIFSSANKSYFKRRFQIDSNISGSRFVCGLSNQFGVSSPTNVEPDTLINTIGVCKLSTSNNLHIFYNDATGLATTVDLGVNYPANNVTAYFYDLEIYKESGTANLIIKVTRIDASGNKISTSQTINSNYNNANALFPIIYGTNNATASAFRFFDFGIIFKNYNLQWNTL